MFYIRMLIKFKSPIGTAHIVAADFNPLLIHHKHLLSPIWTAHIGYYMRRPDGTQ
jgi:hypothetical protein